MGQKMYKCSDGAGGTTFQQAPCAETAKEAEARQKERELREAEAARKKEEEARRKAADIQKARERDQVYQEQAQKRAEEQRKIDEAQKKVMQGTTGGLGVATADDNAGLPDHVAQIYSGAWREDSNATITNALAKKGVQGCGTYRYRQRTGGGQGDYIVNCKPEATKKDHYFVWPNTGAVQGPVRF